MMFCVNVTIVFFKPEDLLGNTHRYMEIDVIRTRQHYNKCSYPWSIYGRRNTATIFFFNMRHRSVVLEYSIQNLHHSIEKHISGSGFLVYTWGHLIVKSLQIVVDVRYRVNAYIWTCSSCHALMYDGPSPMLSMIFRSSLSYQGPDVILASTFEIFLILIEGRHNNTSVLVRYNAIYQPQIVTSLLKHETKAWSVCCHIPQ